MALLFAALLGFALVALVAIGRRGAIERGISTGFITVAQAFFIANYERGKLDLYSFEGRTIIAGLILLVINVAVARAAVTAWDVWHPRN
jgi:hypothetical protein